MLDVEEVIKPIEENAQNHNGRYCENDSPISPKLPISCSYFESNQNNESIVDKVGDAFSFGNIVLLASVTVPLFQFHEESDDET